MKEDASLSHCARKRYASLDLQVGTVPARPSIEDRATRQAWYCVQSEKPYESLCSVMIRFAAHEMLERTMKVGGASKGSTAPRRGSSAYVVRAWSPSHRIVR